MSLDCLKAHSSSHPRAQLASCSGASVVARTQAAARDLRTLARFIEFYCEAKHNGPRLPVTLAFCNVDEIIGRPVGLCPECTRLLAHAFVKRLHCPMDPKPACKNCPRHCYHPDYRRTIRQVMAYSGWRLMLRGRLSYITHFLT